MNKAVLFITGAAALVAGATTAGVILSSKKLKVRRLAKRTGKTMYNVGAMLQALSMQGATAE